MPAATAPDAPAMTAAFSLVVETSTPQASLARVAADGSCEERGFASDRNHNALLFAPLAELLAVRPLAGLERVLVGSGPGSYSGTRVGIAAAQGVALAAGCPAIAIPSLLAVPAAAFGPCGFVGDARRGSYWTATVHDGHLSTPPTLTDRAGLEAFLAAAGASGLPVLTFEDPAHFAGFGPAASRIRREFPTAAGLWRAWHQATRATRAAWTATPPQPIYLKPPHITAAKRPWLAGR